MTGNESANIQELQSKVIQLEKDRSFDTSMIQDHGSRITKLEINMSTAEDNIQSQGARMYVTIDDNQRRISRVELDNNATGSLYQTMEARLTYLEGICNQYKN